MSYYREVYLNSPDWNQIKQAKLAKTSKHCAICGSEQSIDLHHLFYRSDLKETKTSDLRWLCRRCHTITHDLLKSGALKLKSDWSHHAMFSATRSKVRQSLGVVKIHSDNDCDMAKRIDALRTKKCGFTKKALATLGVPWPPPKGWRKKLIRDFIIQQLQPANRFNTCLSGRPNN